MSDESLAPTQPSKRATIHDVAKAANVSPATVSLVLHQKGQLALDTRERVLDAIKLVGYQRRRSEESQRRRRSTTYCMIIDDIGNEKHYDTTKSVALLGRPYISGRDAVLASAESAIRLGLVSKPAGKG